MSAADSHSRGKLRESKPESYPSRIARVAPQFSTRMLHSQCANRTISAMRLVGESHSVNVGDMK